MATKHQVIDLHRANPTWGASDIAAALDTSGEYVRATAKRNGLTLPTRTPSPLAAVRRAAPDLLAVVEAFRLNRASLYTDEPFRGALLKLFDMADAAAAKAKGE